jgi:SPX domain protein involved in polyphosphate accumulation
MLCPRYGNAPPAMVFMERKTHKESWKGEESVKERFTLPEDKVVAFLDGERCGKSREGRASVQEGMLSGRRGGDSPERSPEETSPSS